MNTTKPPAGVRVKITSMPGGAHTGEYGVVSRDYTPGINNQIAVKIDGAPMVHQNDCWVIGGWEIAVPAIGDKVIPQPWIYDDGSTTMHGVPEWYWDKVGTVTRAYITGDLFCTIDAEFQSREKPDDTVRWSFRNWKPADGHTLTVSDPFVPTVGQQVRFTGCLEEHGITDGLDLKGTVTSVTDNIWKITGIHDGKYVSGPGYVFPLDEQAPTVSGGEGNMLAEYEALKAEVARLEGVATHREETIQRLQTEIRQWTHDFQHYAERIVEEAVNRDWCETYESVIDDIRPGLQIAVIPDREQEFEVEVEVRGEISTTTTVTVKARSQEDADEMVGENIDDYMQTDDLLADAVRYNGWDDIETEVQ